jgi:hypothetical protein
MKLGASMSIFNSAPCLVHRIVRRHARPKGSSRSDDLMAHEQVVNPHPGQGPKHSHDRELWAERFRAYDGVQPVCDKRADHDNNTRDCAAPPESSNRVKGGAGSRPNDDKHCTQGQKNVGLRPENVESFAAEDDHCHQRR